MSQHKDMMRHATLPQRLATVGLPSRRCAKQCCRVMPKNIWPWNGAV